MTFQGAIGPENRLVIMNHQSLIDIILGVRLVPGYLTLIPAAEAHSGAFPGFRSTSAWRGFP